MRFKLTFLIVITKYLILQLKLLQCSWVANWNKNIFRNVPSTLWQYLYLIATTCIYLLTIARFRLKGRPDPKICYDPFFGLKGRPDPQILPAFIDLFLINIIDSTHFVKCNMPFLSFLKIYF